ncbi:Haloacid dehalogenase superfamily protein, subfamily IA, variant 3 with third motif having DD or ED [Bosea sp. LC85]|uniref:HAD family hydrolase n=1 Tax=Bosea sp. LC85 TaxID=1502851 RepID=UPI0004E2D1F4|nr:HAD-IA family hydrolase [Bosea sp. LC85]KFC74771.1 Haloacid dehalogenase superfamily protein, subfamily IA, variant 3 with third motif having DD or ED [Bosea sp. LC85]
MNAMPSYPGPMRFKALMVDVDGVLIVHPDPKGWSANLERDLGLSRETLQAEFFTQHWSDIIHGRADLHARLGPALAKMGATVSADTLVRYWFERDAHIDQDLLGQLAELRERGLVLHLATVQEHERARYLWHTLGFERHFDAIHYAAALGWAKPAQGFFAAIEARTGFQPHELFFIDDAPANVEAAIARGWSAAVWNRRERLADLLMERSA